MVQKIKHMGILLVILVAREVSCSGSTSSSSGSADREGVCFDCWNRGYLKVGEPLCLCTCNRPTDAPIDPDGKYLREIQISQREGETLDHIEILGPTCRYITSERTEFYADIALTQDQVISSEFEKALRSFLKLRYEDQYVLHSVNTHRTQPGYSVIRFDIRDDGTGNNFTSAQLSASQGSLQERYKFELITTPTNPISRFRGASSSATVMSVASIQKWVQPIAPAFKVSHQFGELSGYPVYVETASYLFAAIILSSLLALVEASMTTNFVSDAIERKIEEGGLQRGKSRYNSGVKSAWGEQDGVAGGDPDALEDGEYLPKKKSRRSSVGRRHSTSGPVAEFPGEVVESGSEGDDETASVESDEQAAKLEKKKSRAKSFYFV